MACEPRLIKCCCRTNRYNRVPPQLPGFGYTGESTQGLCDSKGQLYAAVLWENIGGAEFERVS
jgi:hypothetical protein